MKHPNSEKLVNLLSRISSLDYKLKVNRFFYLSFAIYILVHIGVVAELHSSREIPWEPDDHYHYISKAENLRDCLSIECPALEDIYLQTRPIYIQGDSKEYHLNSNKNREEHRFLVAYHPLYSGLLVGLRVIGLTYERGQAIVDILGTIIFGLGAGIFLSRVFGRGAAALTLLLLSVLILPNWGTHYVNPWHYANGFTLLAWSFLISKDNIRSNWVTLASVLAVAAHPIGLILYFGTLGIFFLVRWKRWNKELLLHLLLMCLFVCVWWFSLAHIQKEGVGLATAYMDQVGIFERALNRLTEIGVYLKHLIPNLAPILLGIFCLTLSIIFSPKQRDRILKIGVAWHRGLEPYRNQFITIVSLMLSGLFIGSLVEPHSVGLFSRIAPTIVIFLLGLLFSITWFTLTSLINTPALISGKYHPTPDIGIPVGGTRIQVPKYFLPILVFLVLLTMGYNGVLLLYSNSSKIHGHNMNFPIQTVTKVLSDSKTSNRILYNTSSRYNTREKWKSYNKKDVDLGKLNTGAESAVSFFLSYGASKRGAVLSHLVTPTTSRDDWIDQSVSHLVTMSPSTVVLGGDIILHDGDYLRVESNDLEISNSVALYIHNEEGPIDLIVEGAKTYRTRIPSNSRKWVDIPVDAVRKNRKIKITTRAVSSTFGRLRDLFSLSQSVWLPGYLEKVSHRTRIGGLRFDAQVTYWPWDVPINVFVNNIVTRHLDLEIKYQTQKLTPDPECTVGEIVSDKGSIVAAKISCPSKLNRTIESQY
jgi:hypothetical protein